MELVPATRRHLLDDLTVRGYVQDRVHAWTLHDPICPHGQRAIVVRAAGGWSQPEHRSGGEFPLLYIDSWADCSRTDTGERAGQDAISNAMAVHRAVDRLIQGVRGQRWGAIGAQPGLSIVSVERWAEPVPQTASDSHAGEAAALPYRVPLQDAAVVTTAYAVITFH